MFEQSSLGTVDRKNIFDVLAEYKDEKLVCKYILWKVKWTCREQRYADVVERDQGSEYMLGFLERMC